ncbi:MAG TPA: class I SAM-dependent methyltransferase [Candidatus Limnocylindrales bacterium]|nr:class I SAM-dependent methyltransferase [Candidatus Limnocylindrales bacterium]
MRLLRDGVAAGHAAVWCDLGAGTGAFTRALADLLAPGSVIHAIDRDANALAENERAYRRFARDGDAPALDVRVADFTRDLGLRDQDGIVMANSLHFVKDKAPVLARVRASLKSAGVLLLVEYDADEGNRWVPYPVSFETWRSLAAANGFTDPRLLATEPSRFLRRIYSAASSPTAR